MSELFLFSHGMQQLQPTSPETQELEAGVKSAFVAIQDNVTGFPVYSGTSQVDKLYKDTQPQLIAASETIKVGQLLNVYFDGTLKVRLADARDENKFCNSLALTSGTPTQMIQCAVKVAVLPIPGTGSAFLSTIPGERTDMLQPNAAIMQKVGDYATDFFYFHFHTPALLSPFNRNWS